MNIVTLKRQSETRQVKVVFKNATNDHNTLFGGTAMQWMDEVAYITATRFCRKKVVTISADKIDFIKPIPFGTIVELVGKVGTVGEIKLEVNVEIFVEQKFNNTREKAVGGRFHFTAVDLNSRPVRLFDDREFLLKSKQQLS
jgi:acyl-CoA hydrolase